jgi:osmotically inducible protein OsmC
MKHTATFSRRATLEWTGDIARGAGLLTSGSESFRLPATFPRIAGEPAGATTPEELLAGSHATCFGIALRSVLSQRGGAASRVQVTSTISANKGEGRIRIESAHLDAVVMGLIGVDPTALEEIAHTAEEACTISVLLRPTVRVSVQIRASEVA